MDVFNEDFTTETAEEKQISDSMEDIMANVSKICTEVNEPAVKDVQRYGKTATQHRFRQRRNAVDKNKLKEEFETFNNVIVIHALEDYGLI